MKSIITSNIKIPKIQDFDNDYIENTLKTSGYDFVRWAITGIDDFEITVSVSHVKN